MPPSEYDAEADVEATVAVTIDRTDDDVDGAAYELTPTEARAIALLIGTGLCHVSIDAASYRDEAVEQIKKHLQRIV